MKFRFCLIFSVVCFCAMSDAYAMGKFLSEISNPDNNTGFMREFLQGSSPSGEEHSEVLNEDSENDFPSCTSRVDKQFFDSFDNNSGFGGQAREKVVFSRKQFSREQFLSRQNERKKKPYKIFYKQRNADNKMALYNLIKSLLERNILIDHDFFKTTKFTRDELFAKDESRCTAFDYAVRAGENDLGSLLMKQMFYKIRDKLDKDLKNNYEDALFKYIKRLLNNNLRINYNSLRSVSFSLKQLCFAEEKLKNESYISKEFPRKNKSIQNILQFLKTKIKN